MKKWYLPLGLALALFLTPPVVRADTPDGISPTEPAAAELVETEPAEPKPTETEAAPGGETVPSAAEEAPKENAPAEETAPAIRYDPSGNQFFQGDKLLTNQWVAWNGGEYFADGAGHPYANRFITFGEGVSYLMGENGAKRKGLHAFRGDLYLLDETTGLLRLDNAWVKTSEGEVFPNSEGKVYHDRIISFGSTEYYMDSQGVKSTGLKRIGSDLYYFDETTGIMRKDNAWVKTSEGEVFPNSEGKVYHDRIISFGSTEYYMDSQGVKSTGLKRIGSDLYYFDETTRIMRKDNAWVKTSEGEIFPNSEGRVYHDRFLTFGPKAAYYVNSEGVLQTGIFHADGTVYRTDAQGRLVAESSSFQFEGNTYVTNEDGYTYRNTFYYMGGKKYYAGPDGARVTGYAMIDGAMWRFDSNGALMQESSAYEVNGKKYFSKPDGSPYRNQVLTFGDKAYYMGADGSRQYGLIRSGNVTYYAHTGTGELLLNAGLFTVADSTFYSGSRYALSTGLLTFGDVAYYFDPQAEYPEAVKNTTRTIDGITYQFDSTGRGTMVTARYGVTGEWSYSNGILYGPAVRQRNVGSNHVVVSLRHQYMWIFKDYELALSIPIVSGKPNTPTIKGEFRIYSKERNRYLEGPGYKSWVNYWAPFSGDYGIHDASWQPASIFYKDSRAYTWRGSKGCVNVQLSRMAEVFRNISVGTPVTIY